jgi:hypothetical protein
VWARVDLTEATSISVGGSAALPASGLTTPSLCYSLDVNALNYCRFSLLPSDGTESSALVAVPNLVESALVRRDHGISNHEVDSQNQGRYLGAAL